MTRASHDAAAPGRAATVIILGPACVRHRPGVFRPRSDTWLLARAAAREPLPRGARDPRAVRRARVRRDRGGPRTAAAHLTTVDVSRRAVLNARLNGCAERRPGDARSRGDLFAAVAGERFDLILANPPYVPGARPAGRRPERAVGRGPRRPRGPRPHLRRGPALPRAWRRRCCSCTPRSAAPDTTLGGLRPRAACSPTSPPASTARSGRSCARAAPSSRPTACSGPGRRPRRSSSRAGRCA